MGLAGMVARKALRRVMEDRPGLACLIDNDHAHWLDRSIALEDPLLGGRGGIESELSLGKETVPSMEDQFHLTERHLSKADLKAVMRRCPSRRAASG